MNGGQYSADLTHQCTHLIIEISFFINNFKEISHYIYILLYFYP